MFKTPIQRQVGFRNFELIILDLRSGEYAEESKFGTAVNLTNL